MAKIKTYAVKGLIECVMNINVGGALLKLRFSGGNMGMNGVIPANYSTDNEALQEMIENSHEFVNLKRIYLHHVEESRNNSPGCGDDFR